MLGVYVTEQNSKTGRDFVVGDFNALESVRGGKSQVTNVSLVCTTLHSTDQPDLSTQ